MNDIATFAFVVYTSVFYNTYKLTNPRDALYHGRRAANNSGRSLR